MFELVSSTAVFIAMINETACELFKWTWLSLYYVPSRQVVNDVLWQEQVKTCRHLHPASVAGSYTCLSVQVSRYCHS